MVARKENEQPISAQGLVNTLMPAIILASLVWFGGKVEKSSDGLMEAKIELAYVKSSLVQLNADQTEIMSAVGDIVLLRERIEQNNKRIELLSTRLRGLEQMLRDIEKGAPR